MIDYTFLCCYKKPHGGSSYLHTEGTRSYRLTRRLEPILKQLKRTYSDVFPKAPELRLGVIVEPRNGASGYWTVAESLTVGPIFVIEIDPALDGKEEILAHELAHPIMKLLGVPSTQSVGEIDSRIGDELSSTSQHPFVFDLLDQTGYGDEQRKFYECRADAELDKLKHADFSSPTYTGQPGQTWLALWYFNFYILAQERYDAIYSTHKQNASGIADKMDLVRLSWMAATKGKGVMKRRAQATCIRSFQSNLMSRLDLHSRVGRQSMQEWTAWLFNSG